jgi:4-hydroxybenzoate polyprenyltransferase
MIGRVVRQLIRAGEAMPLGRAAIFIASWVFLRIFFEGVLESHHFIGFATFSYQTLLTCFCHFPLFYVCLFLVLTIIIALLVKERIAEVTKVASIGLVLIIFVPLIDWVLGRGFMITYPLRLEPYLVNFLNPLVSLAPIGVSSGQRLVIVLISLFTGVYGYAKTNSWYRATSLGFLSLIVIILFGGLTTILAVNEPERVYIMGGILNTDSQKYCAFYLLIFSMLSFVYLLLFNREFVRSLYKALRLERMAFYGALAVFGFGVSVSYKNIDFEFGIFNYLGLATMFLSLAFGFWGLQVFNDIFDVDIDRMVGKKNALQSAIQRKHYYGFSFFLMAVALMYALAINFPAFLILITYLLLGIVYSLPPVRLKRIPFLSTAVIAVAVILAVAFGFTVYYGGRAVNAIPARVLLPTLISVTIGFVAKDIGHVEGDRINGVVTVPVLVYRRDTLIGRLPVALLISASYIVYTLFIPKLLVGATIFSLVTFFYTILEKRPEEAFYFFLLYLFGSYLFYVLIKLPPL